MRIFYVSFVDDSTCDYLLALIEYIVERIGGKNDDTFPLEVVDLWNYQCGSDSFD